MKIILILILAFGSAVCYRLGGTSAGTKWRDVGCSLIALVALWLLDGFKLSYWWAYLLTFGLQWSVLTTYFKKKGTDALWWNWLIVGIAMGLSALFYAIVSGNWLGFGIRTGFLGITVYLWSQHIGQDWLEEGGRGFLFTASIPLLLL